MSSSPMEGTRGRDDTASEPVLGPALAPVVGAGCAEGWERILQGFALHRRMETTDRPTQTLLAGDRLYADGLVQVAASGDLDMVARLGEVIMRSSAAAVAGKGVTGHWLAAARASGVHVPDDAVMALARALDAPADDVTH